MITLLHIIIPGIILVRKYGKKAVGIVLVVAAASNWAHLVVLLDWIPIKNKPDEIINGKAIYWPEANLVFLPTFLYTILNHFLLSIISILSDRKP